MKIKSVLLLLSAAAVLGAASPKTRVLERIKVAYTRAEIAVLAEYRPEKKGWIVVPTGVWKGSGIGVGDAVAVGFHADGAGTDDTHKEQALVCFNTSPPDRPNQVFFITNDHLQNLPDITTEELKAYLQKKEPTQAPEPTPPSRGGST